MQFRLTGFYRREYTHQASPGDALINPAYVLFPNEISYTMSQPISFTPESQAADVLTPLPEQTFLPDAYKLPDGHARGPHASIAPRVVFIEVTNRCNLLCETCPRTFFTREPLHTLSYDEFLHIATQFPEMRRAVLHGIGEPLLNRDCRRWCAI